MPPRFGPFIIKDDLFDLPPFNSMLPPKLADNLVIPMNFEDPCFGWVHSGATAIAALQIVIRMDDLVQPSGPGASGGGHV